MKQHWYSWIAPPWRTAIVTCSIVSSLLPMAGQAQQASASPATPATILRVQPLSGQDSSADGSDRAPFKTITRALQVATANTVILLGPGTYNTGSGEQFPLQLKPGVTLQGNPQTFGQNVVIQGGGTYTSPAFGPQMVAIVGANQAGLVGVTVTNTQGQGIWVESSSPMLLNNTLTGNRGNGVAIVGNSAPLVRYNQLSRNGVGVAIVGTARPEIRENLLEQLGTGLWIQPTATPTVIGNLLRQNQADVVSPADNSALLQANRLESQSPSANPAVAPPAIVNIPSTSTAAVPKILLPAIAASLPTPPLPNVGQAAVNAIPALGTSSVGFPVPTVLGSSMPVKPPSLIIEPAPARYQVGTATTHWQPTPSGLGALPETGITIPVPLPDSAVTPSSGPDPAAITSQPYGGSIAAVQYRVVVDLVDAAQMEQVRSLMPQAFQISDQGQMVMQVGAFGDRDRANQLVETLVSQGLRAKVERLR